MHKFRIMGKAFKKNKFQFVILILLSLLSGVFALAVPYLSGNFVDFLVNQKKMNMLYTYMAYFVFFSLGLIFLNFICNRLMNSLSLKSTEELCDFTIERLCNSEYSLDNNNHTYLTQRIYSDAQVVTNYLLSIFQTGIISLITLIVLVVFLGQKSILFQIISITFSLIYVVMYIIYKRKLYIYLTKFKEIQNKYFASFQEIISSIKFIRMHSVLNFFQNRSNNRFSQYYMTAQRYQLFSYSLSSLEGLVSTMAQICIYLLGGYYVIKNQMTIGSLTIITSYFGMILNNIRYFSNLAKSHQDFSVSHDRLKEIQQMMDYPNGNEIISSIETIAVKDLSFGFERDLYSKFNALFEKNNVYAISGDNGSGKTTLINIIMGTLRKQYEGTVYINNIDIKEINMIDIRYGKMVYVEQQPFIIRDTIKSNLTMYSKESTDQQINYYLDLLNLRHMIDQLPNGINSEISETKDNFSGGEIQKICIIRALLSNSDVLIFDEPTSAFDAQSREAFNKLVNSIKRDRIIIIITHDKALLDVVDRTIKL